MFDLFCFAALPYVALFLFVGGSVARYRIRAFSYSSLSTQFLEDRWLAWASVPWHFGIFVVLLGHFLAFLFPGLWTRLASHAGFLAAVEMIGAASAMLCLWGLALLLIRRFVDARLRAVTTILDVAVLLILLFQVSTGLGVALNHRFAALWAPRSLGPYLQSILTLRPDISFVKDMPGLVKLHIISAWILLAAFPFTRLVHVLSFPGRYFFRSPQKVVWNTLRSKIRFSKKCKSHCGCKDS